MREEGIFYNGDGVYFLEYVQNKYLLVVGVVVLQVPCQSVFRPRRARADTRTHTHTHTVVIEAIETLKGGH